MKINNRPTRFDYVKYDEETIKKQEILKQSVKNLEKLISDNLTIHSRESGFAIDKLEECWMWIGKALKYEIERENILRNIK
jgi:hypothetical protein